jgi:hypothetical protein
LVELYLLSSCTLADFALGSFIHKEAMPHEYAVSWTTSHQIDRAASDLDNGGHFFIASHGVCIQAALNTLVIWRPQLWHGTSLSRQHPCQAVTNYCQQGLAFVASNCLPTA